MAGSWWFPIPGNLLKALRIPAVKIPIVLFSLQLLKLIVLYKICIHTHTYTQHPLVYIITNVGMGLREIKSRHSGQLYNSQGSVEEGWGDTAVSNMHAGLKGERVHWGRAGGAVPFRRLFAHGNLGLASFHPSFCLNLAQRDHVGDPPGRNTAGWEEGCECWEPRSEVHLG